MHLHHYYTAVLPLHQNLGSGPTFIYRNDRHGSIYDGVQPNQFDLLLISPDNQA